MATIYSSKTYKAIKDYLEEVKYPDEVLSIIPYEAREQKNKRSVDLDRLLANIKIQINAFKSK